MPSRSSLQLCEVMPLTHVWNSKGVLVGGGVWGLPAGRRPWQRTKDLREAKGKEDMGHGVNAGTMDAWRLLERRGPRRRVRQAGRARDGQKRDRSPWGLGNARLDSGPPGLQVLPPRWL